MTIRETILILHSIEDRAKDFPNMTDCDWVAIAAAKRHLSNGLLPEIVSESVVNEFMDTLNFTYDKSEKCMIAKIYNSDLTSLKDIIESKL
jgi:hypothetical protein